MGLDVMFFAGNPDTLQAHIYGKFRNTWWVLEQFKVSKDQNCDDVEISIDQLNDFLDHKEDFYGEKNGSAIVDALIDASKHTDWHTEKLYVNCWW